MSAPQQLRLLLPESLARAGWDVLKNRQDVEGILFDDEAPPESLHPALRSADGVALGHTHFGQAEIDAAQQLRVVARIGVGYDSVDVAALTRRGIPLMMTDAENSVSVAEHTLAFMLALAKQIVGMNAMVHGGDWRERLTRGHIDLSGKTVLIIGFGRIGARTASRCLAMEMRVLVYDAMLRSETIRAAGCEPASDMASGIARADFVCILCPKTKETTNLFNAERLALMKSTAFLINTARGGMVDEAALYQALSSGKLAGAALDVFDTEPLPLDSPLLKLPNFLTAPHVSGLTLEAAARMAEVTVRNILSVLDGHPNSESMLNREALRSAAPPALITGSQ
ncbi:MAG TPA: hydroxyacid dehydrogenase [Xanthobacteraceae bacterium]|nr:hydroxyacid dehydrogenase [Xanthobacteraceae bacterium]